MSVPDSLYTRYAKFKKIETMVLINRSPSFSSLNDAKRERKDAGWNKHAGYIFMPVAVASCLIVFSFVSIGLFSNFFPISTGVGRWWMRGRIGRDPGHLRCIKRSLEKGDVTHLLKKPRVSTKRRMRCKKFVKLCACGWRGTSHRVYDDYP